MLIWFSFGYFGQRFIVGIVKYVVRSPPCRRPDEKYPVSASHHSVCVKVLQSHDYLVATVIHTLQSVGSQTCIYVHVLLTIQKRWLVKRNKKERVHPITGHEGPEVE